MALDYISNSKMGLSNILKYKSPDCLFNASICYLKVDVIIAQRAIENFIKVYPSFVLSKENICLAGLINAITTHDGDKFACAVSEYNVIKPLCNWQIELLSSIKETLGEISLV